MSQLKRLAWAIAEFCFGWAILAHDKYKQWQRQRRWAREAKQKKGGSDGE